ncbi:hypothetical protein [Sorangium sp. So ce1024]|uniref:hypothetical protein n=1 Tax=Sorangium sp. So ce1024 TaxID=3133327 RepID=UPI003F0B9E91
MTEMLELDLLNQADEQNKDGCPFCYGAKHEFPSKKEEPSVVVESKPKQLKCDRLKVKGSREYTTAKHHLISALQCYARVRRLVRMASMVGYDVNDPPNGIGLPTIAKNITYTVGTVGPQAYGTFSDADKQTIAFDVMDKALAQWHVGHHGFEIEIAADSADEHDSNDVGHTVSYDTVVIKKLLQIAYRWVKNSICEKDVDSSADLIQEMNRLSADIKGNLDQFGAEKPWRSSPFYVSKLAFEYAMARAPVRRKADGSLADVNEPIDGNDSDDGPSQPTYRQKRYKYQVNHGRVR